jgi:hypothetical protein
LVYDYSGQDYIVLKINGRYGDYGSIDLKNQSTNKMKPVSVEQLHRDFHNDIPTKEDMIIKEMEMFIASHKLPSNIQKSMIQMKTKIKTMLKEAV